MSTKVTNSIDVELDVTELELQQRIDTTASLSSQEVTTEEAESLVEAVKKEYSIVGDGLYASVNVDDAPEWLTAIVDSVVASAVADGMVDYDNLVQDVRNAIDSIDVARNTYVEEINIDSRINGIVTSRLQTLNATLDNTYATIADLDTAVANADSALSQRASQIEAAFNNDLTTRINNVQTAFANADNALASDITALETSFEDQEAGLEANVNAVQGLKTYVGLDTAGAPNDTGLLSRVQTLENQNDGVVVYHTGAYDVITGTGTSSVDDDELVVTAEPYATWLATDTTNGNTAERTAHIGDVFIQYNTDGSYSQSFKFIKTAQDTTSPYATDSDGFTWALITDTQASSAYLIATQARDLADGKRRVFTTTPTTPYDAGDLWVDGSVTPQIVKVATEGRASGNYVVGDWEQADQQAQDFITNTYTPDKAKLENQLDGKIEYLFYDDHTDVTGATDESNALDLIDDAWTTDALRHANNGTVVYFKDTRNGYWYQSSTPAWLAITDTSIYEALQNAATAQGAADGKVSQFYAWGGENAPADFVRNPDAEPADQVTIPGDNFKYWFKSDNVLYYKPALAWVAVPTTTDSAVYVADGDIVTVFDPTTRDTTVYNYNGTSWEQTGPAGIIAQSSYFLDLDADVRGPNGSVASGLSTLQTNVEAYADAEGARVENKFAYNSTVNLSGTSYSSGFGLNTTGVEGQPEGADGTDDNPFDSEFWVNAKRFVLKNPDNPDITATFTVTDSGIQLGLDHTEATRNEPRGSYVAETDYVKGDMVVYNGSSYIALQDTSVTPTDDGTNWALMAQAGEDGISGSFTDYLFIRSENEPAAPDAQSPPTWYTDVSSVPAGTGKLWSVKKFVGAGGATPIYSDIRVIEAPIIRELTLYSDATDQTVTAPTESTYDFATDTLTINDDNWNRSIPSIQEDGQKVYAVSALVTGNITQSGNDAITVTWGSPVIYAQRQDGAPGTSVTVSSTTYDEETGVTTVTFSDGQSINVTDGTNGTNATSYGVIPVYSDRVDPTSTSHISLTKGTKNFVTFYEWSETRPTAVTDAMHTETFTQIEGDPGVANGVTLLFSAVQNPTSDTDISLTQGDREFVNFYEWTGSAPTNVPADAPDRNFVRFVGTTGTDADNYKEIYLYQNATSTPTAVPSNEEGFNSSTGVSSDTGEWTSSIETLGADEKTYRVNITIRQTNGTGSWAAVDSSWNGPVQITGLDGTPGTPGDAGDAYKEIFLYKNGPTAPTLPSVGGSYTQGGDAADEDGWTTSPAVPGLGQHTWRTSLTLVRTNNEGYWGHSDPSWNPAIRVTGTPGRDGEDGEDAPIPWGAVLEYDDMYYQTIVRGGAALAPHANSGAGSYSFYSTTGSIFWNTAGNIGADTLNDADAKGNSNTNLVGPDVNYIVMAGFNEDGVSYYKTLDLVEPGTYIKWESPNGTPIFKVVEAFRNNYTSSDDAVDYIFRVEYVSGSGYASTSDNVNVRFVFSLGQQGADGAQGNPGAGFYSGTFSDINWTVGSYRFRSAAGRDPVDGDMFVQRTATESSARKYQASTNEWVAPTALINGDLIVDGSIGANKITTTELSAISADLGDVTAGTVRSVPPTAGAESRFKIDLEGERLTIRDESGVIRVKLGRLD